MRPERVRLLWLLVLTAVPAAAVAAVLYAVDFSSAFGLAPQVSAISPYATFFDLRWILVFHNSWAMFAGLSLGAIVLRGLFSAVLVALAWPAERSRPSFRRLASRNLAFAVVATVILSPFTALAVVVSDVSLAYFQFLVLMPVIVLAPLLQRGGILPNWWRGLPSAAIIGWSLLNFVTLCAGAALVWSVPDRLTVPAAAVAGMANGLLWQRKVRATVLQQRVRWPRLPGMPLVVTLVVSSLLLVEYAEDRGARGAGQSLQPIDALPQFGDIDHPVIFLGGYNSAHYGDPSESEPPVVRFSYRGTDNHGKPVFYVPADTHQSLSISAQLLATQVDQLHSRSGKRVSLVGQSEGALVVRYYLDRYPHPAVDTVVLDSPILRAGRVYYPPPQARSGWGIATGWQLRGIFKLMEATSEAPDSPDSPFIRSLLDDAPFYRNRVLCPVPGVRMIALLPTVDAIALPAELNARIPVIEMAGFHGHLIDRRRGLRHLADHLTGKPPRNLLTWEYSALQRVAGAWQAPALPLALNPVWHAADQPDAALRREPCQT
ncbi:hypothetical protein MCAG_05079 [Micromonospora sp. ATCC 39149]|uniref:Alpha/beta hydrolase n=1 Tax=Micromonospora carbonacea TaxID=47853 RepID=A0A7D6C890_9ACTN|nr:hypothetical protein [Micromonospora sp. ATCC 39149]EEP74752.1 hypothetical protein MCAG_05079 [Micromonospora sp. ATCC 39149]QLK00547.1 hypothetical protein HZU44_11260 [Micromonospora carbonacea]